VHYRAYAWLRNRTPWKFNTKLGTWNAVFGCITNPIWRSRHSAIAILKICFWLYLCAILTDQHEIWNGDEGSHADIGHVTKTAIFANSRWRTAAILKIPLSQPRIIRFRSNLVGRCTSQFPWWNFNKKNRNYANSRWRTDAILKIVFWLYLGAILADQSEI